jgi:hypothetical protein
MKQPRNGHNEALGFRLSAQLALPPLLPIHPPACEHKSVQSMEQDLVIAAAEKKLFI